MNGASGISIVVPTFNEEGRIGAHLDALAGLSGIQEVIVVDGQSTDQTVQLASRRPGVRVTTSRRGRGLQLNAGAALARGEVLLFLHADVRLPADFASSVAEALSDRETVAGAFLTHTVAEGRSSPVAHLLWLADVRSRYTRLPYGDQAVFVRSEAFRAVGGFPNLPLMEDLELARRLSGIGRIKTVRRCVEVSGRRFLRRPVAYTAMVNLFPALFRLGVPASRLARLYGAPR